jgi:acyl-CoA synthetase (AMP-forming)/AMP-acid ligase II
LFHTTDLAEILDGQIFLRGRAGDQINVAGRKVSPEFIECALLKHPAVRECLVFGVPSRDAERLEEIVAVIVTGRARHSVRAVAGQNSDGAQRTDAPYREEKALRQFALDALPAWQVPRHWLFVEALQANSRGKVSRAEWRERWLKMR